MNRINMALLNQSARDGGVALPNLLYYYATKLRNTSQWWHPEKRIYWGMEQTETGDGTDRDSTSISQMGALVV